MNTVRTYIVEDNATILENLVGTLREVARVEIVGEAKTEDEGAAWLRHNRGKWDLAIIDLFLKEGSGMNVIEACRDRSPTQKIVVLSNHTTQHVRQRCAELGADAVFDKATEIDELVDFCLRRQQEQLNHH